MTASWTLESDPREIRRIRREVTRLVDEHHGLPPERRGDLQLAVSEIVTTALLHRPGEQIHVDLHVGRTVEFTVRDAGTQPGGGYALAIVSAIADDVQIRSRAGGGTEVRVVFEG